MTPTERMQQARTLPLPTRRRRPALTSRVLRGLGTVASYAYADLELIDDEGVDSHGMTRKEMADAWRAIEWIRDIRAYLAEPDPEEKEG